MENRLEIRNTSRTGKLWDFDLGVMEIEHDRAKT